MESIRIPHLPEHPLQVGLFKDLKNASFLRQQLLEGNAEFEYAFLDASTLISRNHVLAACFRAINDQLNGRMKSRNVHSEIVFSLSPNNNIADSFRRFGIQDTTTDMVAIKVGSNLEAAQSHLLQNVEGSPTKFTDEALAEICDATKIKKIYKVDLTPQGRGEETFEGRREAEAVVLGMMALKGS